MENWASAIIGAIVAGFTFLTALATLATKRNDSSSMMTNKSFDIISKRLDIAEAKVSSLENIQSDYRILKDDYDDLRKKYSALKLENTRLSKRVKELELKEGKN